MTISLYSHDFDFCKVDKCIDHMQRCSPAAILRHFLEMENHRQTYVDTALIKVTTHRFLEKFGAHTTGDLAGQNKSLSDRETISFKTSRYPLFLYIEYSDSFLCE